MKKEVLRFVVVGCLAVAIQFAVYQLLLPLVSETWANTVGYAVSFCFNYLMSTRFTFQVKPDGRNAAGFAFSHLVNYLLQTLFLNVFLYWGVPSQWAQLPMFALCVPINFFMVRFFLKSF